jgi:hypothetical protein
MNEEHVFGGESCGWSQADETGAALNKIRVA